MFYSLYSQEQWATGWIGDPSLEPHATDFVRWLRMRLSGSADNLIPGELNQESTLRTLRELWHSGTADGGRAVPAHPGL